MFLELLRSAGYSNTADMIDRFMKIIIKGRILSKKLKFEKKSEEEIQNKLKKLVLSEASPSLIDLLKIIVKHDSKLKEESWSELTDNKMFQDRILAFLMDNYRYPPEWGG